MDWLYSFYNGGLVFGMYLLGVSRKTLEGGLVADIPGREEYDLCGWESGWGNMWMGQ